jgi:Fe-S oxidoreductase
MQDFAPALFNQAALLCGSEGTLAVIRQATVNLVEKPKFTILGVLAYESIIAASEAVPGLLAHQPSAVELIPQMLIRLARSVPAYASQLGFVQGDPAALLVVEFSGPELPVLREKVLALRSDVLVAESSADQAKVWAVRKVGLGIFDSRPAAARPVAFIEDCAIPVERLGEFVGEVQRILDGFGTTAAFYAHASAGCLHIRPILNLKSAEGVRNLRGIAAQVLALTLRLGGAMSSEHGDGLLRAEWLKDTYGAQVVRAFDQIKQAADPDHLLNPKKMNDAPAMDTNLRYGTSYRAKVWTPLLNFNDQGSEGLAGAIEQCNGQGVCRKSEGSMCPSFQATREEMHSTRGRANLLRAMISLREVPLPEAQVKQALDLCLACKGCKAECPSGVDMAKLKYEFQSHYYESHRRPLRDYLFGYIDKFAWLGAPLGGLINRLLDVRAVRRLANKSLGLSQKRHFPRFVGPIRRSEQEKLQEEGETCLLLPDTFTHFFENEIEQSARNVLAACAINVKTLPVYGAGRTLLSKGFLAAARKHASQLLDAIRRMDPEGVLPVIGLEPSEIYTLRDEMLDLLPARRAEVQALAARSWLIDEYLIRPGLDMSKLRVASLVSFADFVPGQAGKVGLHGHCYQKAQPPNADGFAVGVEASAELLRNVGYAVSVMNTGCCGMAGAFGYETEHYDVSMAVGELRLLPEVRRSAAEDAVIAAVGTSCRSQISDGTGVQANHPIRLVAQIASGARASDILKQS